MEVLRSGGGIVEVLRYGDRMVTVWFCMLTVW